MTTRLIKICLLAAILSVQGCGVLNKTVSGVSNIVGLNDTAVVSAKTAQIRTSYAVVAADLLEVKRGDRLEVLDQIEFEKVPWVRVRASDEAQTEGWIEAQNVLMSDLLERSKKLAEEFRDVAPQAAGQLRSVSNLRLAPDMNPENLLFKMSAGSSFEIMGWQYVPKQEDAAGDDPAKTLGSKPQKLVNDEINAAGVEAGPLKIEDKYDIWYKVKLDPSVSSAPAGWLFGRQVELSIPSDIVYYQQNNRRFVGWQRLDSDAGSRLTQNEKATPGNWVVLTRSGNVKSPTGDEPNFDGIMVLAFDKYDQSYYTVWRTSGEVWGTLPMRVEGTGDNKAFTVRLKSIDGRTDDKRFVIFKDKSRLKVTPPEDIGQYQQARSRQNDE